MRETPVRTSLKVVVAATYVAMIALNALANALPINGRTTGEVSDSYPSLFAPAGITFAMWGLIYVLTGIFVVWVVAFSGRSTTPQTPVLERISWLFLLSNLANAAWILSWHYDLIAVSTALIVALLVLLALIATALRSLRLTPGQWAVLRLPFSVYFGWVSVATIANITVLLVSLGWDGCGVAQATWTVIILAVGALIGCTTVLVNRDIAYGAVFVWAYGGIWLKHTSADGFAGQYPQVSAAALVCIAAFILAGLVVAWRGRGAGHGQGSVERRS